jgi:hypothetical protein
MSISFDSSVVSSDVWHTLGSFTALDVGTRSLRYLDD